MFWIFAGPVVLLLVAFPALLPYRSLRLALRNGRHADGSRSRSRSRREARHAARLLGKTLLLPLGAFVLLEAGLFLFHRYAVPDPTLQELFGEYLPETSLHAPDLDAWNEAIAAAERDAETEALRDAADAAQHRRARTRRTPREVLFEHWPLHLVFLIVPSALLLWFLGRFYLPAARAYHAGVRKRHDRYRLRASLRS